METPKLTIPPPPPPPPPSLSVYRRSGEGNVGDGKPDTTVPGVLERQLHRITAGSEEAIVVSRLSPLRPVLQEGPQCGLVALSMASQLLQDHPVSVDTLFGKAKSLQFTKKGEMFSVGNMKALAETCLQNPCSKIVRSNHLQREELIRHLLEGKPALIPYDSDGNFEPCLKRGHTAHWAVLHGICIVLQSSCIEETLVDTTEVDSKCSRIFHIQGRRSGANASTHLRNSRLRDRQHEARGKTAHMTPRLIRLTQRLHLLQVTCRTGCARVVPALSHMQPQLFYR
ncbi:actin maturation protease [Dermacentor albipictus]|uniref:actin maturation protease n=1 Tax=Dermacentor albipictus TaxID=60249 RepID=UPI0038FCEC23